MSAPASLRVWVAVLVFLWSSLVAVASEPPTDPAKEVDGFTGNHIAEPAATCPCGNAFAVAFSKFDAMRSAREAATFKMGMSQQPSTEWNWKYCDTGIGGPSGLRAYVSYSDINFSVEALARRLPTVFKSRCSVALWKGYVPKPIFENPFDDGEYIEGRRYTDLSEPEISACVALIQSAKRCPES